MQTWSYCLLSIFIRLLTLHHPREEPMQSWGSVTLQKIICCKMIFIYKAEAALVATRSYTMILPDKSLFEAAFYEWPDWLHNSSTSYRLWWLFVGFPFLLHKNWHRNINIVVLSFISMLGLLSTYCQAGRAESHISAIDLVGLSIQRDRLIYQNYRLLMFMSLVAIYMSFPP